LPIPPVAQNGFRGLEDEESLDSHVEESFELNAVDRVLIEDGIRYVVPELLRDRDAPGQQLTGRGPADPLIGYCDYFLRVLAATAGHTSASAAVFQEVGLTKLPLRLIAIYLDEVSGDKIQRTPITISELRWPSTPEFLSAASRIRNNALAEILRSIWIGYDRLATEVLAHIDIGQADAELERTVIRHVRSSDAQRNTTASASANTSASGITSTPTLEMPVPDRLPAARPAPQAAAAGEHVTTACNPS